MGVDDYSKEITKPGEPGRALPQRSQIMKGYINRPDETAATLRDGWLLTGDIAVLTGSYFSIVDRKKDMIISGGFNVYPRDVDEVLFAHPKILEACVIVCRTPIRESASRPTWCSKKGKRLPQRRS